MVTIEITDGNIAEEGQDAATLTITRTGSTAEALTVLFSTGGNAESGIDYTLTNAAGDPIAGNVVIAAGSASATITITPADDPDDDDPDDDRHGDAAISKLAIHECDFASLRTLSLLRSLPFPSRTRPT